MSTSKHPTIVSQKSVKDFVYLKKNNATLLDEVVNSYGQLIQFYEDPIRGEDELVWIMFPDFEVAFLSDFWDTNDMAHFDNDYTPIYIAQTGDQFLYFEIEDLYTARQLVKKHIAGAKIRYVYTPVK